MLKQLILTPTFFAFTIAPISAQDTTCDELANFVKSKGYYKANVPSYILDSEWLTDVTAYSYEYKVYVIAKVKKNEWDFSPKSYVFCGIPENNWNKFSSSYSDNTYGERFHTYIMDYQCDCR
jgi:hypothetical protein